MNDTDKLCINTIRFLSAEGVQKANSGHPGAPMGLAPLGYTLWTKYLKHNPKNPHWHNRDRFVLSGGHASMLLYSLLHLTGYDLSLDDLKNFRQWNSKTPGHPEYGHTPGVETTTGPLGQGFANAVGMAMAEQMLAARFNKDDMNIVDHHTYVTCGDGDLMEGISYEAASLAGHLKLGKLIVFFDDNTVTIDGHTDLSSSEDINKRFESMGWQVIEVKDGNEDLESINKAIEKAQAETSKPTLVKITTLIGYGAPNKQNTEGAHGSPLGEEELGLAKKQLGWEYAESFTVPEGAQSIFSESVAKGKEAEEQWNTLFDAYEKKYPEDAKAWHQWMFAELPENWEESLPTFEADEKGIASRKSSGQVLNAVAPIVQNLVGGSADLHPSTNTYLKEYGAFTADSREGRNFHYGIREHAMGAINNGIAVHGGFIPLCSTFLVFSDYMRTPIRLAALMNIHSLFVYTHDSVGVGEDGPTHQPVEHVATLRAIPNLLVFRPGDANETRAAWKAAIEFKRPATLILSRQNMSTLEHTTKDADKNVAKGAYIVDEASADTKVILMATGTELQVAIKAKQLLEEKDTPTRVVSMPCWELFREQNESYQHEVLPTNVTARVAIEAGSPQGWAEFVGDKGTTITIDHFGASAPGGKVLEEFGFTAENVANKAEQLLKKEEH